MPLGADKEAKVSAEFKKHEQEIMEKARKKGLRDKFHFLDAIKGRGNDQNAVVVGDEIYEVAYDDMFGKFVYTKQCSGLVVRDLNELQQLLDLYNEEKLGK